MKILHTADFHLSNHSIVPINVDVPKINVPINVRTKDTFDRLDYMIKYAINNNIDYFIIAGDVFDNHTPSMLLKRWFAKMIKKLIKHKINVIILVGNHDSDGEISAFADVKELIVESKFLKIVDKAVILHYDSLDFYCLPFSINKQKPEQILTAFHKRKNYDKIIILIGHLIVDGAKIGEQNIPAKSTVTVKYLCGYNYVALGDLHINQQIGNPRIQKGNNIWYSGSIIRKNMGETDEKYFNIVEFKNNKNMPIVTREKLEDRKFLNIETDFEKFTEFNKYLKNQQKVNHYYDDEIEKDSVIKFKVSATKNEYLSFDINEFRKNIEKVYGVLYIMVEWLRITKKIKKNVNLFVTAEEAFIKYVEQNPPKHYQNDIIAEGKRMIIDIGQK